MNCTGQNTEFRETLSKMSEGTARIARIAKESQAECERMHKRIEVLEGALKQLLGQFEGVAHGDRIMSKDMCAIALARNALKGK